MSNERLKFIRGGWVGVGVLELPGQSLIPVWIVRGVTGSNIIPAGILCPVIIVLVHDRLMCVCGHGTMTRCDTSEGGVNTVWVKYSMFKGPSSAYIRLNMRRKLLFDISMCLLKRWKVIVHL